MPIKSKTGKPDTPAKPNEGVPEIFQNYWDKMQQHYGGIAEKLLRKRRKQETNGGTDHVDSISGLP